ncbi:MAG: glycosyltransferase family 39 protein [Anaerolineales bacterium]|nr:glycosyltransferase family 39 protein [Chloroflexota bacterium]MBL6982207.1 glycosyltransferase family 39 protein [Anaerolineales bacterium]
MTTDTQTIPTNQPQAKTINLGREKIIGGIGLLAIIALGAFLRFYQLGTYTIGNTYYAATVKSMLTSWHNFFFASFEPGGSVTVDKPPLGFWVQAISAYFLGVNGFALALPQALAGTLSIPVLYHLVRKYFGVWAGLTSALVLALVPVTIATERNNTIDGLLVFVLLLAAWAFIKATETGKTRHLVLGAFLVGLGFNIKMLQAYMVLPAFYAVYFLGARTSWWKRILQLGAATIVLLVVSLAWVVAVDLTPADERPFIGSSEDNTVMELIVGHNGLKRLGINTSGPGGAAQNAGDGPRAGADGPQLGSAPQDGPSTSSGQETQPQGGFLPPGNNSALDGNQPQGNRQPPPEALEACEDLNASDACTVNLRNGDTIDGTCYDNQQGDLVCVPEGRMPPPAASTANAPGQFPDGPDGQIPGGQPDGQSPDGGPDGGRGNMNGGETGTAGVLRLFEEPLVTEASWLLPLVLLGLPVALVATGWSWPSNGKQNSLLLWAGWLLPAMAYFSFTTGLFHRYYLIMLGPPLAALVGISLWSMAKHWKQNHTLGWLVAVFITGCTIIFEIFIFRTYPDYAGWVTAISIIIWLAGIGTLAMSKLLPVHKVGLALVMIAMLVAPFTWSALTTMNTNPNVGLPTAGAQSSDQTQSTFMTPDVTNLSVNGQAILDYLLANTDSDDYLLATLNARGAAPYILETGRSVLTFGGFGGRDDVVSLDDLIEMIENGELRYILGLPQQKQEISQWMINSCNEVDVPGVTTTPQSQNNRPGPGGQSDEVLYDCGS